MALKGHIVVLNDRTQVLSAACECGSGLHHCESSLAFRSRTSVRELRVFISFLKVK